MSDRHIRLDSKVYSAIRLTDDDLLRVHADRNRDWAERRQAAQLRKGELLHKLGEIMATEPVASAVLKHHRADRDRTSGVYCEGCDMGCSCEAASWPCSTVVLLLGAFGADTTDIDLIDWKGDL